MPGETEGVGAWRSGTVARRRPRYGWKPGATPLPPRARAARIGLALAALGILGAFAYLVYQLTRPPRPLFVAVGVNPEYDALRLDAPPDFLGWRSAVRFLASAARWGPAAKSAAAPHPLPAGDDDAALDAWLRQFKVRNCNPVIVYFGVHAGTARFADSPDPEPVLFAGGGPPIRVKNLVRRIGAGPLSDRRVVLLLDPARFRPDPVHGYQSEDFPTRMKALDDEIAKCHNLVVVSGADSGQRGWESDELGATAFLQAVVKVFDDPIGRTDVRSAGELFTEAAGRLKVWTANNRQALQSPFLLPLGEPGTRRAGSVRLAVRPESPDSWDAAPVPTADELARWRELWAAREDRLKLTPHPAAYTPRAWRRYDELLLRHDAAMRAGLPVVTAKLADAARTAAADLGKPFEPVFGPRLPASFDQSLAFDVVKDPRAADPSADLWKLASAEVADLPPEAGDPQFRPSERHLAVMVNRFYRDVLPAKTAPRVEWKNAIAARVQADRAALGLPPPGAPLVPAADWSGPAAAFSERVRHHVRPLLAAADANRRLTEDHLFGGSPAVHPLWTAVLYHMAAMTAAEQRFAFHVRDAVLAELPHLGRWAVATGFDADRLAALWAAAHRLDAALVSDAVRPAVGGELANVVWAGLKELRDRFEGEVRAQSGAALQGTLLPKEELLATPLLRVDDRERLLIASRQITFNLLTKPTGPTATAVSVTPAEPPSLLAARGKLFAAELGVAPGTSATQLADLYRRIAPLGKDERESRVAVAFEADPYLRDEPAAIAARQAWARLLDDLAERAVADHWYDEQASTRGGQPYYRRVATRYHEDAARLVNAEPRKAAAVDPLAVETPDAGLPMGWTSERRRTLGFNVKVPATRTDGAAVVIPKLTPSAGGPLRLTPATADPRLVELRAAPGAVSLDLESTSEDETPARASAGAALYFRGQRPGATRTIDVNRRPELVVTDPGPPTASASVAVRADPTQPLPPVVILLDYSGSMKEALTGFGLEGPADAWKEGGSKFNLALRRLELVLAELPKGTPLRVRQFSARDLPDAVVYPFDGQPAVVDWQGTDTTKLRDLMARLRRLEPAGTTPLIDAITTAARNDFPPRADGPKTLVVLTDGADDSGQPGVPKEVRDGYRAGLKNTLAATGVKLVVVQFALNESDKAVSKELFADLGSLDVPGEVVSADDADALRRELTAAIWPKLVLSGGPAGGAGKYPPGGWPARPPAARRNATALDGDFDPNSLYWSPPLNAGNFTPRVAGYPDPPFSTRGFPAVGLAAGDFLSLSLTRTGTTFHLRRELHADAFGPPRKAFRADGGWVLSVPSTGIDDATAPVAFGGVAVLERVPPHRRKPAVEANENPLRHVLPGGVWWQVSPAGTDPPLGPPVGSGETKTVVSRLYGYPAPAWDVRCEGWPRTRSGDFEPATVRAWVTDFPPDAVARFTAAVPGEGSESNVPDGGRVYRVTVERQTFAGSKEPMNCLVVRTEYAPGDPVQLRFGTPVAGVREEHRYYRRANGYTAVFGPWPPAPPGARVGFEVVRAAALTGDPAAEIRLTPPAPDLGRRTDDYRPVPTRIGP